MNQHADDRSDENPLEMRQKGTIIKRPRPRPRVPCIAATLGFLVPGLGHLYAGKPRQGALWYLVATVFPLLLAPVGLQFSFRGFVLFFSLEMIVTAFVMLDGARVAGRRRTTVLEPWQRWWFYGLIIVLALALSIVMQVTVERQALGIRAFQIPSESMEPGLLVGDHIMVDLRAYAQAPPARGDIVVFRHPKHPDIFYIKRVAAIGGDTVYLKGDKLYVNGKPVDEPYIRTDKAVSGPEAKAFGPVTIRKGQLFVLGDNRDHSYDSRRWGTVGTSAVVGKAIYIYWSWDAWKHAPRMARMGMAVH